MRILEMKCHLRLRNRSQELQKVAGIKSDFHRATVIFHGQALFALAGFRKRRMDLHLAGQGLQTDGAGALIGKLCYPLNRFAELFPVDEYRMRLILRKYSLKIREVSSQLTAEQQPISELEKEMIFIS